jgi:hypothetical protein
VKPLAVLPLLDDAVIGSGAISAASAISISTKASPSRKRACSVVSSAREPNPGRRLDRSKEGGSEARDSRETRERAVELACALAAADKPSKVIIENNDGTLADERVFGTDRGVNPSV